jgi:hypothetical protein
MNYDGWKSLSKGFALLLWGIVATALSAAVGQIPAIDAGTAGTPTLESVVTAAVTGLLLFSYGAFNNWRKHSPSAPPILRDLDFVPILRRLFPVLLVCLLAGCATNRATFTEKLYDPETGNPTSDTTFSTNVTATVGSKVNEGAGSMSYQGKDWKLDVGGSANGLKAAGDPTQMLGYITQFMQGMATLFKQPAPAPTQTQTDLTLTLPEATP